MRKKLTTKLFIEKARLVHGKKYSYRAVDYINCRTPVKITCKKHGTFLQKAQNHLSGSGCPLCARKRTATGLVSNTKDFITKSKIVHGNKYKYSNTKYINSRTKVEILCKKHGPFSQRANNHINGTGCPGCTYGRTISIQETAWLDSLNILEQNRQVSLVIDGKRYVVDGYDPISNTVYEFNGDLWHGNPDIYNPRDLNPFNKKTFGELFESTEQKKQTIISAGYNYISIWENDWNKVKGR